MVRRLALLLSLSAACAATPDIPGERAARSRQPFESAQSILLDLEFDGTLRADGDAAARDPKPLIVAQLMYTVGQLNAERSVGRFERLVLSNVRVEASGDGAGVDIRYHAKLPVAWGKAARPSHYTFVLPARVGESDQIAFAQRYGATCVDASSGNVAPGEMFFSYRPDAPGCSLDASDVVYLDATASPSAETTTGKYPEYDRIWQDGILEVVAMFGRDQPAAARVDDVGVQAFGTFLEHARGYVVSLQSDASKRTEHDDDGATASFAVTLDDGRKIAIHAKLVGPDIASDGAAFDSWFDAVTPAADLILYNGHAELGGNVRTLATKGSFRSGQYTIWAMNGCDTFAYVDRTLADRRALLNADDPTGTKYMDQITNVMPGFFDAGTAFTMTLLTAAVSSTATYTEILEQIEPEQVAVVTGEEDNQFRPKDPTPVPDASKSSTPPQTSSPPVPQSSPPAPAPAPAPAKSSGCAVVASGHDDARAGLAFAVLALAGALSRRRGRCRRDAQLHGSVSVLLPEGSELPE